MPSESKKIWARHVASLIGGSPTVAKYLDEEETASIDVLTVLNDEGKFCATIGLMDSSHEPQVEILMDSRQKEIRIENIISMAAFYITKDGWRIKPGAVFETIVSEYHPELPLQHLLFIPQYQFGESLSKVELPQGNIYPLLAVPISTNESEYVAQNGVSALEQLWEKKNTDVFNWHRKSST